ncbi:MAG TPA: F0F1 ATP synthase subunit gamma [Patescibacteria group bacterium]|nr:F0F1 ATP synthase subunit gamma [Patescibacteria group bacterium]
MAKIKSVQQDIYTTITMRELAQAFQEIALANMQKERVSVINSRTFAEELSEVFVDTRTSYQNFLEMMVKKKKKTDAIEALRLKKNGKDVLVLLTANDALYGDIVSKVLQTFSLAMKQNTADVVIIGRMGKNFFESAFPGKEYTYFVSDKEHLSPDVLNQIAAKLVMYENVKVYFGKFLNVLKQEPQSSSISGEVPMEEKATEEKEQYAFLFEPTIQDVLSFFETQIFSSLFKQTLHESDLALYASRVVTMERVGQVAQRQLVQLKVSLNYAKRMEKDKKQRDRLAGAALWK